MSGWFAALVAFLLHDLIVLILVPVVLLRRKHPTATLAWILGILLFPLVGAVLFLLFGNERLERQTRHRQHRKRRFKSRARGLATSSQSPIDLKGQLQLFRLLEAINQFSPVGGADVTLYTNVTQNYDDQLEAIRQAKREIHICYYIFEPDRVGVAFQQALIEAAKRGVTVRFLYDGVGTRKLEGRFLNDMRAAGVQAHCFIPVNLLTRRWIFNFRNHRKILVVDGSVGFVGGANIGVEYIGEGSVGEWFDAHLRLKGPVVRQLQMVFAEDWAFASGEELTDGKLFAAGPAQGEVIAQVVAGGPDETVAVYHELFFSALANAVERVRVSTPYFVPDESVSVALQTAARRGVDVKVLVPGVSTHPFVQAASASYYEELLEAGVEIYEFEPGFVHAKILTVDSRWSLIGTANFDNRSMLLNFEVGVAFYDSGVTMDADRRLADAIARSRRVDLTQWRQRSIYRRVFENSTRLFSPIL